MQKYRLANYLSPRFFYRILKQTMGKTRRFMFTMGCLLIILYYLSSYVRGQVHVEPQDRIDCYPDHDKSFSKESCSNRNCLFDEKSNDNGIPRCFYAPNYGYKLQKNQPKQTHNGLRFELKRNTAVQSPYQDPIENVILDVQYYTNDILHFKLYDADKPRYEVPIPLSPSSGKAQSPQYEFKESSNLSLDNIFSFVIKRRSTSENLFDTSLGGLVLNNQFLQIVTRLQSSNVYGFGENNHDTLKHNLQYTSWGIFARDQGTNWMNNTNHYGQHPFYLVMEQQKNTGLPSGNMHGVLLLNSNAMDYSFTPTPSLTMRTIGGILDFYVFMGPQPEAVIQQYTWLVGRSILPPYWSLGFQLSRWDYSNLTHMKNIVKRNLDKGIPLDVQYADIDYMDAEKDFTVDPINYKGLKEYFNELRAMGMHTIVILDPGVIDEPNYQPTVTGKNQNVFVKWENGTDMKGSCWPGDVYFPDFFLDRTKIWWEKLITDFRNVNLTFDGLWIDMNEPALFETNDPVPWNWADTGSNYTLKCPYSQYDDPPYRTKSIYRFEKENERPRRLSDRTLCMAARQGELNEQGKSKYRHYDVHSLYGWSQTKPTFDIMQKVTGKRSLVLPRSTFIGSGQWSGHWLGDNEATWHEMKRSLIGMIEFNWFGIPFNGADICGFDKTPTEEMCIRWMQVGAFYPFSRNHNIWKTEDQDPAHWSDMAVDIMVKALKIRYLLLPYYYTLFYKAHTQGSTVIRPLFHEYPQDRITTDIFLQFLIGPCIMIAPVTDNNTREIDVYIPSSHWYDFHTGKRINMIQQWAKTQAPLDTIPIFLRGGYIIPTQEFANNTVYSRQKPFGLIIVLNSEGNAEGDLFYDDGDSIGTVQKRQYYYAQFKWSKTEMKLAINVVENNYQNMNHLILDSLTIYGLDDTPASFVIDGRQNVTNIHMKRNTQILELIDLNMKMTINHTLAWSGSRVDPVDSVSDAIKNPEYRADCHPDLDADANKCRARGCEWDQTAQTAQTNSSPCYVPKSKGGYELIGQESTKQYGIHYKLKRLSTKPAHKVPIQRMQNYRLHNHLQKQQLIAPVETLIDTKQSEFSLFGNDIDNLRLEMTTSGTDMIRLKITDLDHERYEVPVPIVWRPDPTTSHVARQKIKFRLTHTQYKQAGIQIVRTDTNAILFDTSFFAEGFIYDDKYLQFMTTIPSRNIYGMGENTHPTFQHVLNSGVRYGIFARDQPPLGNNENLYGTHPFYMVVENDGNAFGVLIFNSNAQDYKFNQFEQDQSMLTYRTIGGILDIFFFAGPTPEDVIQQYQHVIGNPYMPPYWALGFHLCRYGYNTLENMQAAVNRTISKNIPLDVVYGDIDYFYEQLDFTWDSIRFKNLPEYVDTLHTQGMKFITILDPAIDSEAKNYSTYTRGQEKDIWIKWPKDKNAQFNETGNRNMLGYVWPIGRTVFPDYFSPAAISWWKSEILNYHQKLKFDALWIDMNEPANFDTNKIKPWNWPYSEPWNLHCPIDDEWDNPPYKPVIMGDRISDKTLCMIAEQTNSSHIFRHYDVHNLYGWSQIMATLPAVRALDNKRSIIISRSTFPTSGKAAGHWLGDNAAAWSHVKYNLIGLLEFNLFGIPYVGADICGFEGNTTEQLCQRWMQLGAFNPFFRNHNGINYPDQDPGIFSPPVVESNRKAVETRYTLIPYLYSLFHHVHISGGTVIRSMVHEFSKDSQCWSLDEQFLWGSYLLIAPVVYENHTEKVVYFPGLNSTERWYDYYLGKEMYQRTDTTTSALTVQADYDYLPLYIRGGAIIPHQKSAINTVHSRLQPMYLKIALDKQQKANGDLFWDDGESIDTYESTNYSYFLFHYDSNRLTLEPRTFKYTNFTFKLDDIHVYGLSQIPQRITLNNQDISTSQWNYEQNIKTLHIQKLQLDMSKTQEIVILN
ncbi:unnamed protein product [Didymodactylos carnosus]|uniref:alpha-glucosidase n=1 Tax=Didymodactylos carnosus TaxID=1234261 RepID=A0A813WVF7_9BILA|nr:unnamed protein product [Didymodactylos carnosus]CAF0861076.1 unnamed protein product [Didymodactylos carnosus]CAF3523552.1 unnamed protein product [Didymodactylos carnosus]CAF3648728.1 unnamed protein product [Didymodactylos carnosus]